MYEDDLVEEAREVEFEQRRYEQELYEQAMSDWLLAEESRYW